MKRGKNEDYRQREYLTPKEVEQLLKTARDDEKHGHRNYCLILLSYYHGLRASEACNMTWEQINFNESSIFIKRVKKSKSGFHPLKGIELRALRKLQRETKDSKYLFNGISLGTALSTVRFRQIIQSIGKAANLGDHVHPHMLRHSTGFYLAQSQDLRVIQNYLGHRNISNTVRYTELDSSRFDNLFQD